MNTSFLHEISQHQEVFEALKSKGPNIHSAVDCVANAISSGKKILLCGNGGSAADCQHFAAEFTGRYLKDRRPLAAISLTTDTSAITCIANDYSFESVFERQVHALGAPGDCLICISTSGGSKNVLRAAEAASEIGLRTIALTGRGGGALAQVCELSVVIPSVVTARIQEAHIFVLHYLCSSVEARLGLSK